MNKKIRRLLAIGAIGAMGLFTALASMSCREPTGPEPGGGGSGGDTTVGGKWMPPSETF